MVDFDDIDATDLAGSWDTNFTTTARWAPNTTLRLASVPWDAGYRDIVEFFSQSQLNSYLDSSASNPHKIRNVTHIRPGEPIRLNIPHAMMMQYNYIHVHNPAGDHFNSTTGDFYYFILDSREISPNTTELIVQLDVWQTFHLYMKPGVGYLERGHVGIANNIGSHAEYLTTPEGLDVGNEYNVVDVKRKKIASTGANDMSVVVWSTTMLFDDPDSDDYGDIDNPKMFTAMGSQFESVPNGATPYIFSSRTNFVSWLEKMSGKPWVTQGIIGVYAIPPMKRYGWELPSGQQYMSSLKGKTPILYNSLHKNWRDTLRSRLPQRYRHLEKFLTFPYSIVEITTNTGAPIVLKPEQWKSNDAQVVEMTYLGQPSPRIIFSPRFYNTHPDSDTVGQHDGGEYLDITTGIYDFPTFSVVNNGYMSFMASNRHSIRHQYDSADWSQQRALRSADTSYDNTMAGLDTQDQLANDQVNVLSGTQDIADRHGSARTAMGAATSIGMGIGGGTPMSIAGGALSAATQAGSEAINRSERSAMTSLQVGSIQNRSQLQGNLGRNVADANLSLSQFAARGDYQNQVAGINAKVQDAKLTQPTVSGQSGGEAFNLAKDQWSVDMKLKMVHPGVMRTIGDFWLKYGYAINAQYYPETLQVMTKFTYWKFTEFAVYNTNIPENYKKALRGIFEKGVTVWRNPDDIGATPAEQNEPIYKAYY